MNIVLTCLIAGVCGSLLVAIPFLLKYLCSISYSLRQFTIDHDFYMNRLTRGFFVVRRRNEEKEEDEEEYHQNVLKNLEFICDCILYLSFDLRNSNYEEPK